MNKTNCVMLIDDNEHDNFFHEKAVKRNDDKTFVITMSSARKALEYLTSMKEAHEPFPRLIFLDINMPGMNGWEFLQEYNKLSHELQSRSVILMLTTSDNVLDKEKAKTWHFVSDYIIKPLTHEMVNGMFIKYSGPV